MQSTPYQQVPLVHPRHWLLCLSVAILGLMVMADAITGPFLLDDESLIVGNHYVHGFEHWTRWFTGTLWDTNHEPDAAAHEPRYWRPVVLLSYAVDWSIGRASPLIFHVTNTTIHAANCALAYHVLSGWVPRRLGAWLGAATFAVHPVQTEPVAFIAGRTDVLCLFGLLVVIAGIRARRRAPGWAPVMQLSGAVIAFGAKEAAVVLPVLVFIEFWSERQQPLQVSTVLAPLRATLPSLAVAIGFLGCYLSFAHSQRPAEMSLARHGMFVLEAWGRYAALVFWPDDLTLGRALIRHDSDGAVPVAKYAALGAGAAFALLAAAWRLRRVRPAGSLGLLAFALLSIPVSGIVWLGYSVLVSPRFLYLPMLGIALCVAACLSGLERRRSVVLGTAAALLVALSIRSWTRAGDYDSDDEFWRVELTRNPEYWAAQEYFIVRELNAGRRRSALRLSHVWFRQAAQARGVGRIKARLVLRTVDAVLALTPDVDRQSLSAIHVFVNRLSTGSAASLELAPLTLDLKVEGDTGMLSSLAGTRRRLQLMAAEAASRLGDDAAALRAVDEAITGCNHCWSMLARAAIVAGRAGNLPLAHSLASDAERFGPPGSADGVLEALRIAAAWQERWQSSSSALDRAGFYLALGAFGRAHAAAEPMLRQTQVAVGSYRSLADLAMRAGDVQTARRLLGAILPPAEAAAVATEMASVAPWMDRPMPPETWLPAIARDSSR